MKNADFLNYVEASVANMGFSATGFGKECMGDPSFVHELRRGRECKEATKEHVINWILTSKAET